jgi:hypothetical protein
LLRVTVEKHLLSVQSRFPETVEQLREQLYVDDYLGGADDELAAIKQVEETDEIFKEAKLNMRSWATNDETTRLLLEEKGLCNNIVGILSPTLDGQQKVLGILWDT